MDNQITTVKLSPVTITGETMAVLRHERNYSDLLALYVTYAEITQWQYNKRIKATTSFMQKRMGWGRDKVIKTKQRLVELGLVSDIVDRANGKISSHLIQIEYVVNTTPLKTQRVEETDTSSINIKDKELNKKIAGDVASTTSGQVAALPDLPHFSFDETEEPQAASPHYAPDPDDNPLDLVPCPKHSTDSNWLRRSCRDCGTNPRAYNSRWKALNEPVKKKNQSTEPTVHSLHYAVIKKYQLPVSNHNEVRTKSKRLEDEIGAKDAMSYLQTLLDIDYLNIDGDFKPELNHSRDIYNKRVAIQKFLASDAVEKVQGRGQEVILPTPKDDWGF